MDGLDMSTPEGMAKIKELDLFRLRCSKHVQNSIEITNKIISYPLNLKYFNDYRLSECSLPSNDNGRTAGLYDRRLHCLTLTQGEFYQFSKPMFGKWVHYVKKNLIRSDIFRFYCYLCHVK